MKNASRKRILFIIASVIVSGAFLWVALNGVPLAEVWDGIRQANLLWVALAFVGMFLSGLTRAIRWRGLVGDRAPLIGVFHAYNIAMLLNLLPLRAGELGRTVVLSTRFGVPLFTAATSVVVERLMDLLMVVVLLALGLSRISSSGSNSAVPDYIVSGATLFAIVAIIGFIVLIILARYPSWAHRLLTSIENRLPVLRRIQLSKRLEDILVGLEWLTHPSRLAHAVIWSLLAWTASLFTFWCLEMALNVQADTLAGAFLGVSLASLSIAVPVSVASIGPFESAVRIAGDLIGVMPTLATTLGFLFHGVAALGYIAFGVISVLALGVSLGDLMKSSPTEKGDSHADA